MIGTGRENSRVGPGFVRALPDARELGPGSMTVRGAAGMLPAPQQDRLGRVTNWYRLRSKYPPPDRIRIGGY